MIIYLLLLVFACVFGVLTSGKVISKNVDRFDAQDANTDRRKTDRTPL